jgi:flagellar motor switch protein FliN/FliY
MMGGDGSNTEGEINDLHLSAICEVMNQMIGSSATSISQMVGDTIDISPPKSIILSMETGEEFFGALKADRFVKVSFKMEIEKLIESEIMQLLPIGFSKSLANKMLGNDDDKSSKATNNSDSSKETHSNQEIKSNENIRQSESETNVRTEQEVQNNQQYTSSNSGSTNNVLNNSGVNVQPANFQNFDDSKVTLERKNVDVIMDIPLQVTVELGRTNRLIKDILEFGSGTIIELDKLAGEHVDILVNGKRIAKGEVVVIDESFGVRITEIVQPSMRV